MACLDCVNYHWLTCVVLFASSVDKESGDTTAKINELRAKFQKAREQIEKLPGIEYSQEEQERQLEVLRKQLAVKSDLLLRYKNSPRLDLNS